MFVFKLYFHVNAYLKIVIYKLIYKNKFRYGRKFTFRKGVSIAIDGNGRIEIGNDVFFNNYVSLTSNNAYIRIGDGSVFGEGVKIYDHNHCYSDISIPIKDQGYSSAPVTVGAHCWVASNVLILKGVTIGNNCVIGAGCVIYKDVPANTVIINKQDLITSQI
jgi:acetyltransferase-like isoleucine patch superfamily enzyme